MTPVSPATICSSVTAAGSGTRVAFRMATIVSRVAAQGGPIVAQPGCPGVTKFAEDPLANRRLHAAQADRRRHRLGGEQDIGQIEERVRAPVATRVEIVTEIMQSGKVRIHTRTCATTAGLNATDTCWVKARSYITRLANR